MYAQVTANGNGSGSTTYKQETLRRTGFLSYSRLQRPQSVRINVPLGVQVNPEEVYTAITSQAKVKPVSIARSSYGDLIVSLKSSISREKLLGLHSLELPSGAKYEILDPVNPITNVTVLDVPFEISDKAIYRKLERYGNIISSRRGSHQGMPSVQNGMRHFRIKLRAHIPSFIHFGAESLRVRYSLQPMTCRKCDRPGHQATSCKRQRCFNCNGIDHMLSACPENPKCAICEEENHHAEECPEWQCFNVPEESDPDSSDDGNEDSAPVVLNQLVMDLVSTPPEDVPKEPEPASAVVDESETDTVQDSTPVHPENSASAVSKDPPLVPVIPFPSTISLMKAQAQRTAEVCSKAAEKPSPTFTSWGEEIEEGEIVEPNTSMKRTLSEDSQTSAETMEQTQTKDDKLKRNRKKNK